MCFARHSLNHPFTGQNHEKNIIIGGFNREWTREGETSQGKQLETLRVLTMQMEGAENANTISKKCTLQTSLLVSAFNIHKKVVSA